VLDKKYDLKFAFEAKPNEARGDMYNATTGHILAFIETLDPSGYEPDKKSSLSA